MEQQPNGSPDPADKLSQTPPLTPEQELEANEEDEELEDEDLEDEDEDDED